MTSKENNIAKALSVVGVLAIFAGIVLGLFYGTSDSFFMPGNLQGITGMLLFINGVVWGIVFFGFSEIIKLLQGIFNQREKVPATVNQPSDGHSSPESRKAVSTGEKLDENNPAYQEITDFYSGTNMHVQEIRSTEVEDFYLVIVNDTERIIELGGFNPIMVSRERAKSLGIIQKD